MNNAGASAQPAGNRTQNKRHEGEDGSGRDTRGRCIGRLGRPLLDPIDRLLISLLDLGYLFVRFLDRDATGIGKGLCRLLAGFVATFLVTRHQGAGCIHLNAFRPE